MAQVVGYEFNCVASDIFVVQVVVGSSSWLKVECNSSLVPSLSLLIIVTLRGSSLGDSGDVGPSRQPFDSLAFFSCVDGATNSFPRLLFNSLRLISKRQRLAQRKKWKRRGGQYNFFMRLVCFSASYGRLCFGCSLLGGPQRGYKSILSGVQAA